MKKNLTKLNVTFNDLAVLAFPLDQEARFGGEELVDTESDFCQIVFQQWPEAKSSYDNLPGGDGS